MKILHYALGFPPYRSGGMTKLCVDLMAQQANEKHRVAMLWPGQIRFLNKKTKIRKHKNVIYKEQSIQSYEIVNPLPVSLDEGISDVSVFTTDIEKYVYEKFLDEVKPDVIHIHTLMGIHKCFLETAKNKDIRLVFTTHDFFPICPKVTMFRHGSVCSAAQTCTECGDCNTTALSLRKIRILQLPIYRKLKDFPIVKKMRQQHRDNYLSEAPADDFTEFSGTAEEYKKLRKYYYSLLKMMDTIHYNSSVAKKIFETFFELPNNHIINITHADIRDHRTVRKYSNKKIRIRYLGPNSGAKGYMILKNGLDELWKQKKNFQLDIHFKPDEISPYMKIHQRYSYLELNDVFLETDILIAPSIWYETFGFTVLEALSYGVPVIISSTVGAKDILSQGAGIVLNDIDADKICSTLEELTAEKLEFMNKEIIDKQKITTIDEMSNEIERILYKLK